MDAAFQLLLQHSGMTALHTKDVLSGNQADNAHVVRRSPFGVLADIASGISEEDIAEARREMWAGFPGYLP